MNRTRLNTLASVGDLTFNQEPAAPEGGSNQEPQEGASNETPAASEEDAHEQGEDQNDFDSLPDWAKAQIKSLRSEAGRYRTANKELDAALKEAKSQEDIDAATETYRSRVTELELELAKTKHTSGLPESLAALVDGSTPDEIKAKADAVRAAFASHVPPTSSSEADGGLNPGGGSGHGLTPRERAERVRRNNRRR